MSTVILLCFSISALLFLCLVFAWTRLSFVEDELDYQTQLQSILSDDDSYQIRTQATFIDKWNRMWSDRAEDLGLKNRSEGKSRAGGIALGAGAIITVLIYAWTNQLFVSFLFAAAALYLANVGIKAHANKSVADIEPQLPGFLFALKANLQAKETPARAIVRIVDDMPSPLRDDLIVMKQMLLASSTFEDSVKAMEKKTKSRDLKFLCACMIQSSRTGSPLEGQIDIIQRVLENRRKVSQAITHAVRKVSASIWVATFVIPAMFGFNYLMTSSARDFWFKSTLAWILFGLVIALYAAGMIISKKLVDKVKSL